MSLLALGWTGLGLQTKPASLQEQVFWPTVYNNDPGILLLNHMVDDIIFEPPATLSKTNETLLLEFYV